ncbi:MAG: hypothetical protein U9Q76_04975 [candidate division WOR-3 bacterium]|nr:hypothetical protein [candidate division WOR-3 bacterium]
MSYRSIPAALCFVLGLMVSAHAASLQGIKMPEPGNVQIIKTSDGSTIVGRIIEIREDEVVFETELDTFSIGLDKIESIRELPATSVKAGSRWFPNPNAVRLYVGPTARPLSKGKGYVADYMLFFPYVAYGITPNISLEGGMTLIPGLGLNQIIYYRPKIGFQLNDNVALAGGLMGGLNLPLGDYYNEIMTFNFIYAVGTFGIPDLSVTLGLAYGGIAEMGYGGEWMEYPAIMLGGEFRVARGVSIVTENYYAPDVAEEVAGVSYGLRFYGERFSVDACFVNAVGEGIFGDAFPGVPILAVAYNF